MHCRLMIPTYILLYHNEHEFLRVNELQLHLVAEHCNQLGDSMEMNDLQW